MKKLLFLVCITFLLSGCNIFNNEKLENKQSDNNNKITTDNKEVLNSQDSYNLIKDFIEKGYLYESYNSFTEKEKKKILSDKMIAETNLPVEKDDISKDLKREVRDIHLYQETENKNRLVYDIKVKLLNTKTKQAEYTRRYGTIQLIEDKDQYKIDSIQENYTENLVNFNQ